MFLVDPPPILKFQQHDLKFTYYSPTSEPIQLYIFNI